MAQTPPTVPNDEWSTDFKGHFRTGDRRYIYPLTIADQFSRYLLTFHGLLSTSFEAVWPVYERVFREYGLPRSIVSDNGTPFSSNSVKRLSKLSVRWIRLGIRLGLCRRLQLDEAARNGVMRCHFRPMVHDGVPASAWQRMQLSEKTIAAAWALWGFGYTFTSGAKDAWPMWTADGKRLYFMSDRSGADVAGGGGGG